MTPPDPARRIDELFDKVWETLDLPRLRIRRFEDRWQWSRWEEAEAYSRWRRETDWWFRYLGYPHHAIVDSERAARLRRWDALKSQDQPGAEPAFSEVAALRAIDFLREVEELCRESARTEELAICLTIQGVLLARALARDEEAEQLGAEAWTLGAGEDEWRVHAAIEQVLRFLNGDAPAGDYLGEAFPRP
jgi:hypothetical protein